jgi:RNA polymerase primary sigma factor
MRTALPTAPARPCRDAVGVLEPEHLDLAEQLSWMKNRPTEGHGSVTHCRYINEPAAIAGTVAVPRSEARLQPGASYDSVRMYLREIGKVPLLTAPQEVDLAMRIEGGEMAASLLATTNGGPLDRARFLQILEVVDQVRAHQLDPAKKLRREGIGRETVSLLYRPRSRDIATAFLHRVAADEGRARAKLIEANLRRGMLFLDLAQEGNLGLMRAVQKFDYRRGFKFSTYATWWIRQAVSRAVADQARTIRLPVHITEHVHKVSWARQELVQSLGRDPDPEEIGRRVGLPGARVQEILLMQAPISLESPVGEEADSVLGDFVEDHDVEKPPEAAVRTLLQDHLAAVLHTLNDRERGILEMRFGFLGQEPGTLEEVSKIFGVSRERIRQIESKALSKLRHPSRSQQLRDYLD